MNKSEESYFIEACFSKNLQEFYTKYVSEKKDRIQLFFNDGFILKHRYWTPSNRCCISNQLLTLDNISIKKGYWTPHVWKPIHKDLLKYSIIEEIYRCQCIDMNCNDCKYFERILNNKGKCIKKDVDILVNPNTCQPQNIICFKHRKDE